MAQTNIPHLEIIQAAIERAVGKGLPRLSVSLIDSVAQQESSRRHVDEDGKLIKSGAGARGYLQIMPAVETDLKLDASDLTENIYAGVEHLAKMHKIASDKYGLRDREAAEAALTMYNFGAAAYEQALKGDRVKPPEAEKYPGEVLARVDSAAAEGGEELDQETLAQELGVVDRGSNTLRVAPRELEIGKETFVAEADKPNPDAQSGIFTTRKRVYDSPIFTRDETVQISPEEARERMYSKGPIVEGGPGADLSGVFDAKVEDTGATEVVKPKVDPEVEAPYLPLGQVTDVQTQAEAEKPSFLSRIGGAIKNNPMVASQIAQVVGGIGSGILGGRRMAKEQAKSARRQREAMNMANAISTLTRGRTQPAVAPRPVISKPGGAETIFDILGTLGQGGAQITQGIQQREEAAEDRSRAQEMEDFQKDLATRELDIEELKVKGEMREQQIAAQIKRLKTIQALPSTGHPEGNFNPLEPGEGDFIKKTLNELKALHAEGGPGTTGYFSWDRKWLGPAELQNEFDGKRNMLINNMRKVMGLGRLTKEDLALVLKTLPEVGDTSWELQGKIDGILGIVDRLEQRSAGVLGLGAGDFAGTGGDYSGMTNEALEKLLEADPDNEAVVAVIQDRLREDN